MSEVTVRLRLDLAYDGAAYVGWAVQPGLPSIQGEIETGLGIVLRLGGSPSVTVAGRTDRGVHARHQVAHVDVPAAAFDACPGSSDRSPEEALQRRLTGVLPKDIVVHRVTRAPAGFEARYSAIWRRYSYTIVDDAAYRDPLQRGTRLWHSKPLDVEAMDAAAQLLLGEHDFLSYCKPRLGATTIRTLLTFQWRRVEGIVVAEVRADAFCHSMVRGLVGACISVGEGRWGIDGPRVALSSEQRDGTFTVAKAHGLVLEEVAYPPDDQLAARAQVARALRTPVIAPAGR